MSRNVNILKHGDQYDSVLFHCFYCGCEFTAPRAWCGRQTYGVMVVMSDRPNPRYWYKCPECHRECHDKLSFDDYED